MQYKDRKIVLIKSDDISEACNTCCIPYGSNKCSKIDCDGGFYMFDDDIEKKFTLDQIKDAYSKFTGTAAAEQFGEFLISQKDEA